MPRSRKNQKSIISFYVSQQMLRAVPLVRTERVLGFFASTFAILAPWDLPQPGFGCSSDKYKAHLTAEHRAKTRWGKVMHRTATTLVDYQSTKAESWGKKKKNMIPKAQPRVLHTLLLTTASRASRFSKTGKDDKKWCSLTQMNIHWSENSLEREVKDCTGQLQENRRHTGRAFAC